MPADVAIEPLGTVSAPAAWVLPLGEDIVLRSIRAHFDGTGATTPFVPVVQLILPNGDTGPEFPLAQIVAAGASVDSTWFPGVNAATVQAAHVQVVGARIYSVAIQTFSSATAYDFTYDTVDFDTNGMANLGANNRILTAQVAGLYLVIASITYAQNNVGIRQALIYKNGYFSVPSGHDIAPTLWNASTAATATGTFIATLTELNVGDFISCGAYQTSGGSLSSSAGNTGQPYQNYLAAVLTGIVP